MQPRVHLAVAPLRVENKRPSHRIVLATELLSQTRDDNIGAARSEDVDVCDTDDRIVDDEGNGVLVAECAQRGEGRSVEQWVGRHLRQGARSIMCARERETCVRERERARDKRKRKLISEEQERMSATRECKNIGASK